MCCVAQEGLGFRNTSECHRNTTRMKKAAREAHLAGALVVAGQDCVVHAAGLLACRVLLLRAVACGQRHKRSMENDEKDVVGEAAGLLACRVPLLRAVACRRRRRHVRRRAGVTV